ncbi:NAD(P)-binding protein [Bradyrhizobium sp. AZCC 1578]|uniref:NAD(P)-binding protein n=1 Tax=Bradyrhizobium sp. AZCC 1578 TaxID=3117027 RepID=UPI002FF3183B
MATVFIIGGGLSGLTAAVYLAGYHRHVAIFDDGASRAAWIVLAQAALGCWVFF